MNASPEFSRRYRLDRLGAGTVSEDIVADADECAALARRFGLISVDRLQARCTLRREGGTVFLDGHLTARAQQRCVATDAPVPAEIDEDFAIRFVPAATPEEEEIELDADSCDTIFYQGGAVDLGEAAAETLALSLDPFPRSAQADEVLHDAGVLSEEEAGPFGALAGLRDKLAKKSSD
ncbi:YceD family protein [Stakelama saccharophila]|uniref:DUF177 domain-containing protein n=1 Tax=Stakelama saccharophila TaxID=3075605 RepID=A0ABZ0BA75_9SPHN|nr:DUF177 domain-containing protein [Stakelama sp. W311]WNO54284.1 DUF177 domain-containing protein [Stakelama sp. W311]